MRPRENTLPDEPNRNRLASILRMVRCIVLRKQVIALAEQLTLTVDRNVMIPMRDGIRLGADIYRPAGPGPFPTVLQRSPYDKSTVNNAPLVIRAASAGYAVALVDTRGRFDAEGPFEPFIHERDDGYDTLEWLASQPWCNGRIGMYGGSYNGLTQWQAALSGHPALQAIVPNVTADNYHDGWTYQGGAFELSFNLSWTLSGLVPNMHMRRRRMHGIPESDYQTVLDTIDDMTNQFAVLPLAGLPVFKDDAPYYDEWLAHPSYDEFWAGLDVRNGYERLSLPVLNMGGWYDIFLKGTLGNFTGMRAKAATPEARRNQHLLIGPWNHDGMRAGNPIGATDFGRRSTGGEQDVDGMHLRWYDRWLRDIDNGVEDEPPVKIFVMGSGASYWRTAPDWPLPETDYQRWYLHSDGRANTLNGDGSLSRVQPAGEPPDSYVYNPRNPTPSMGGGLCCNAVFSLGGAFDQRPVENREDVLVYSSPVLAEPLEVVGPVKVILYAASSAVDTDFTAKLVDVEPCGLARNLTDSIIRARYRNSMAEPELLTPGEVVAYEIDLLGTANLFQKGHRIRVEISSSNFPRFDRNLNTGEDQATATEMVSALQTVLHTAEHPSCIVLPVVAANR